MSELRYSLLTEGPSDRALIPILSWLLREYCPNRAIQPEWADLRRLPVPPKTLADKIVTCLQLYPCDLLFVHRDADKESREKRVAEIENALTGVASPPAVCVVPVRMLEAWLLHDEYAIRKVADNAQGEPPLNLPAMKVLESLPDPKAILFDLVYRASGYSGRRLARFKRRCRIHDITKFIRDFRPLRKLIAFQAMEEELRGIISEQGWDA